MIREEIIVNWVNKTIEYQEKRFYIVSQFDYKNTKYLCGVDVNTLKNENMEFVFLYRLKDNIFEHVENEKLFEELLMLVSGKLTAEEVLRIYKKYNK